MTKVTQDIEVPDELEKAEPVVLPTSDEETGSVSNKQELCQKCNPTRSPAIALLIVLAEIALVFGLAFGLTRNGTQAESTSTTVNYNLPIFDKAVTLIEANPRKFMDLPSGETMSYREYNAGKPHKLVMLPGYRADDTSFSIFAALPALEDHHIIAVNHIGSLGDNHEHTNLDHEENADMVMGLLSLLGIKNTMAAGYSTGGGIAFYMAKNYPDRVPVAFLLHSIALHGVGEIPSIEVNEVEKMVPPDDFAKLVATYSTNLEGYPPQNHKLLEYFHESMTKYSEVDTF